MVSAGLKLWQSFSLSLPSVGDYRGTPHQVYEVLIKHHLFSSSQPSEILLFLFTVEISDSSPRIT